MGTWSEDILGSDSALDALGNLSDIVFEGNEALSLYPLPSPTDKETIVFIEIALRKHEKTILNSKWDLDDWPIVAAVYMATGTAMPAKILAKSMKACQEEIKSLKANKIGWSDPKARIKVLENFIGMLDWHEPGKITSIEHKGLFQKMYEKSTSKSDPVSKRYKLGDPSQVEHSCCYDAVVVDTSKPIMIRGEHYKNQYERVCECFDEECANKIVDALNRLEN